MGSLPGPLKCFKNKVCSLMLSQTKEQRKGDSEIVVDMGIPNYLGLAGQAV